MVTGKCQHDRMPISADGPDLYDMDDLLEGMFLLHKHVCDDTWSKVTDEGLDGFIVQVVDLLLPRATQTLPGDGWALTKEADDER